VSTAETVGKDGRCRCGHRQSEHDALYFGRCLIGPGHGPCLAAACGCVQFRWTADVEDFPQTERNDPVSTAETTHPLSWLSAICTPDRPRKDDICAHPWLLEWGGRQQVVATDASLIVVLGGKDAPPDASEATQALRATLLGVIDRPLPPPRRRADAADLAAWCGPYDPGQEEPCETCGGDGRCECPRCDGEHDCGVCRGSGRQGPLPPFLPGVLAGPSVDRNRLIKAVAHLQGTCKVYADKDAVVLAGPGWRVMISPLVDTCNKKDHPEFTAWLPAASFSGG
jgi:hypothetical protein